MSFDGPVGADVVALNIRHLNWSLSRTVAPLQPVLISTVLHFQWARQVNPTCMC
jgi:hypothetical protein